MTMPMLYSFRRCPYAMRARLAIASAGVQVELREILLRDKPAQLVALSEKATVPVLNTGKVVIDESLDIMHWALTQNDPEKWLMGENTDLIAQSDGPFKDALDRYKYGNRFVGNDPEIQRGLAAEFVIKIDGILQNQPFLGGKTRGLADMAIVTFIRQFANVDRPWFDVQNWPHVASWLQNFLVSQRFAAIMQKHAVWQPDSTPIIFPRPQ